MSRNVAIAVLCGLIALAATADAASAQQSRRYQPATPTTSPYLNLTRPNFGGLPNYYSLVRPQLQQQSFVRQQQAVQAQQWSAVGRLSNQLQQAVTPTGKAGGFMTYGGAGAGYLISAPYYPPVPAVRRR